MARYPQIADAIIHIEPPPPPGAERTSVGGTDWEKQTAVWRPEFEAFVDRKTREAPSTPLARYLTGARRAPGRGATRLENAGRAGSSTATSTCRRRRIRRRPACHLVFVQSRDGNTGARDPSLLGGGDTDKHLIYEGLSRVAADAVLSGAETIRGGHLVMSVWHPELVRSFANRSESRAIPCRLSRRCGASISAASLVRQRSASCASCVRHGRRVLRRCCSTTRSSRSARGSTVLTMPTARDLPYVFRRLRDVGHRPHLVRRRPDDRAAADRRGARCRTCISTTSAEGRRRTGTPLSPRPLNGDLVVRKRGTGPGRGRDLRTAAAYSACRIALSR